MRARRNGEVGDLRPLRVQEDVAGFQIAVDGTVLVGEIERHGNLAQQGIGFA
jgi:hypothetical protein